MTDEEGVRRSSFFRIKDDIILAKSVLIEEKALHLRQFFANKVKNGGSMACAALRNVCERDWLTS